MGLTFYEKAFANNYEELITYYPAFCQQVYEMREILKAQGRLVDGLESGIERAYLNNFIDYADTGTVGTLEGFLGMGYNRAKSLEARRAAIKAHFIGNGKVSASAIASIIKAYAEVSVDIELKARDGAAGAGHSLCIQVGADADKDIPVYDIIRELKKRVPCHIKWALTAMLAIAVDISGSGKVTVQNTRQRMFFPFFHKYGQGGAPMQESHTKHLYRGYAVENKETAGASIVRKKNLWHLDGAVRLDGGRKLNAKTTEEVL